MVLEDPCSYDLPSPQSADEFEKMYLVIWRGVWGLNYLRRERRHAANTELCETSCGFWQNHGIIF